MYTLSFCSMLGLIGGCVWLWSYYYMDNERNYNIFRLLISRFIISILFLIFTSDIYVRLIGWDLLGITSFLLVIYYKNRKRLGAGILTALSNRMGDCFFMISLGFMYVDVSFIAYLVLLSITKRAQFPFSSWLPAAMAAPTPVSALVHSSTLVTAGVYMLIRYCHIEHIILSYIGGITLIFAGMSACGERDIKKIVAWRTLSQLGFMFVALGAGEKSYCFFHLLTHACFKALLFLCIGFFIHSNYGTQDGRRFNNMDPQMRALSFVSMICLIGFAFTRGFYRKHAIIESLYQGNAIILIIFFFGVCLTCSYSYKIIILLLSRNNNIYCSNKNINWLNKIPVLLLGIIRVAFGSRADHFNNPSFCSTWESLVPFLCLSVGVLVRRPYNRMVSTHLLGLTQKTSQLLRDHQTIDKGWVEMRSLSISIFSNSVLSYGPMMSIGLGFLFLLYGQYL